MDNLNFFNTQKKFGPEFYDFEVKIGERIDSSIIKRLEKIIGKPCKNTDKKTIDELNTLINKIDDRTIELNNQIKYEDTNFAKTFEKNMMKSNLDKDFIKKQIEFLKKNMDSTGPILYAMKKYFNRVRPSILADKMKESGLIDRSLTTTIKVPGHPAYPSGHATQSSYVSDLLSYYDPVNRKIYKDSAIEISENRELAGVHYHSDTVAGYKLGEYLASLKIKELEKMKKDL